MNEGFLLKARISESGERLRQMEERADAYIRMLRDIIDPYAGDFTETEVPKARLLMDDYYKLWAEARELKALKARMERDLNG